MGTVWTIIGWGVVAVLGLMLLSVCFIFLIEAIVMLPAALALAWGLFFLGLPFYAVHYFDSWWWVLLCVPSFALAYMPVHCILYLYEKSTEDTPT